MTMMDDDTLWGAIDEQRVRVADLLEGLADDQWSQPSLCDGWTVRDVGAHLTLQQLTIGDALRFAVRHPTLVRDVNKVIHVSARLQAAALTTEEIVATIRGMVGQRRHNVGLTVYSPLIDILVHGLDIAVPLGLELELPPEAVAEAATRVRSQDGQRMNRVFKDVPLRAYRLVATDTAWATGDGPEIRGPIAALLLLLTGRPARLGELTGAGADLLRRQVVPA
jgi:uncharacterized protein (TIGR03083 family)